MLLAPGEALTYATHRLLGANALAREFPHGQISPRPYANNHEPRMDEYKQHAQEGFVNWTLSIEGMVAKPVKLTVADIRASFPVSKQVTQLACEEGWTYIAEWIGAPLARVLEHVGADAKAKYVVFYSLQKAWWGSIDMNEARHPQTLLAYGMNGGDMPRANGGPLRLRVPRQLGYKSLKFINRMVVAESVDGVGNGKGAGAVSAGYSWYAGI